MDVRRGNFTLPRVRYKEMVRLKAEVPPVQYQVLSSYFHSYRYIDCHTLGRASNSGERFRCM